MPYTDQWEVGCKVRTRLACLAVLAALGALGALGSPVYHGEEGVVDDLAGSCSLRRKYRELSHDQ
jgi:hypothetical protein